jgi:hypothetical protein
MLPENSLSKIIDYFFIAYSSREIQRAGMDFFGLKEVGRLRALKMNEAQYARENIHL